MTERIGFIGLGVMGRPMARNLLRAGCSLVVADIVPAAVDELVAAGAQAASHPQQVAEGADVVITMLPDTPEVEQVVFGTAGLLAGLRPGSLLVEMSTVAPATSQRVAAAVAGRQAVALDAPVSGGQVGAEQGTLSIMVGGDADAYGRALPILQVLGKNIVHMGGPGAGQVTKAANQLIVAATIAAVGEALLLAAKSGVDPARVRQVLLGGFASSRILELHGQRMLDRQFDPGFRLALQLKDIRIVQAAAASVGLPLPVTACVANLLQAVVNGGAGGLDHSALVAELERQASFSLPGRPGVT